MPEHQDTFLIMLPPGRRSALQGWRFTSAHLAYRLGPHLLRAQGETPPRGGLMVVNDQGYDGLRGTDVLCGEIVRECQSRGFSGAVLDFEGRLPPLEGIAGQLDGDFARRGWELYVPERYAARAPHARVMISSAISGGSFRRRLEEALERFGQGRVVLALERVAEDFYLPAPTGRGKPLSQEELEALMMKLSPSVFFSGELCERYFTYMSRETGAHFVLFDDGGTLCRKLEVARSLGIRTFLVPWQEAAAHAAGLGMRRLSPSSREPGRSGT